MGRPTISVLITTFDKGDGRRTGCLTNTVQGILNGIQPAYPELFWIIADDGSPNQEQHLSDSLKMLSNNYQNYIVTDSERGGVGKSKNIALEKAFEQSPYVLILEDDWLLSRPLNLSPFVDVLRDNKETGIVRFGYLGGEMDARYKSYNDISFWELGRGSGVYIYSGQVSLRHKRFYDICGYHPEGVTPGEEELEFCKRYNGTNNAPSILWPGLYGTTLNAPFTPFINVGMDFSLNDVQPGAIT
jgi:hypothetical protein